MKPIFFKAPADLRDWLERNAAQAQELWVGFHKKRSGKLGITYPQALDEALCFGWIDGVRKGLDEIRFVIRFTPRKPKSNWSAVNIKRVHELTAGGRMKFAGLAAFARRDEAKSRQYSYEARSRGLDAASEKEFEAHARAWAFFQSQAPSYRRTAVGGS